MTTTTTKATKTTTTTTRLTSSVKISGAKHNESRYADDRMFRFDLVDVYKEKMSPWLP